MLFAAHVGACIVLIVLAIDVGKKIVRLIGSLLLGLNELLSVLFLLLVELQDLELTPYEVCLLHSISECVPMSARDEPADHAGIVALAYKYFQSVLILKRYFHVHRVRIVDLPQQIAVMKSLKGKIEFPSVLLHRRLLLHCCLLYAIRSYLFLSVAFLHFSFLAELHYLEDAVHILSQRLLRLLLLATMVLRLAGFLLLGIV